MASFCDTTILKMKISLLRSTLGAFFSSWFIRWHFIPYLSSAPPQVLNVLPGQPVDLRIRKNLHEYYKPSTQSRNTNAFTGTGTRLGAPIPAAMVTEGSDTMPGAFPSGSGTSGGSGTKFEVNQTLPTTSVQIRLADGTRSVLFCLPNFF